MINESDAFDFFRQNKPLPEDSTLESITDKFNEVVKYFLSNPDPSCVPLFINCFGAGSGFGVYHTIEDLICGYDDSLVITHLKKALFSKYDGVRYWCAQIAANYKNDVLIDGLVNVYNKGDIDSKCAALTALSNHDDTRVSKIAKQALKVESDEDLQEIAKDILSS